MFLAGGFFFFLIFEITYLLSSQESSSNYTDRQGTKEPTNPVKWNHMAKRGYSEEENETVPWAVFCNFSLSCQSEVQPSILLEELLYSTQSSEWTVWAQPSDIPWPASRHPRWASLPPACTPSTATSHWFRLWNRCNHHLISSTFIQSLTNSSLDECGSFPRTHSTYKSPSLMLVEQYFSNTNVIMTLLN